MPAADATPINTKPTMIIPTSTRKSFEFTNLVISGIFGRAINLNRIRVLNAYIISYRIIFCKMAKDSSAGGVKGFVKDIALGAASFATVDAFLEVSQAPGVNNKSPVNLVDPQESLAETILYGSSLAAIVLGLVDVVGGKSIVPGYGKTLLGYGIGGFIGTQFYENEIIKYLGIRDST